MGVYTEMILMDIYNCTLTPLKINKDIVYVAQTLLVWTVMSKTCVEHACRTRVSCVF